MLLAALQQSNVRQYVESILNYAEKGFTTFAAGVSDDEKKVL
jgi:hypothetical protein